MNTYTKLKAGSLGASLAPLLSAAAPAALAASTPQAGRPPTQPASTQAAPTPDASSQAEEFASCEGRSGWRAAWPTIFLDSCQADRLSGALAAGASAAALAGLITAETGAGPADAGAIAGVLGFYGSLSMICNSWDTGIAIVYIPYPNILTCAPQQ